MTTRGCEKVRFAPDRNICCSPPRPLVGAISTSNYHYYGGGVTGEWVTWGQPGVFPFQPPISGDTFSEYP